MAKHIVVVGAGVVGISTALELLKKGYRVTILAKWLPGDMHIEYTSPWAGAHWRTMAPNSNKLLQAFSLSEFDAVTYRKFMELAKTHPKEAGLMIIPSTDYYDELTPETTEPWFRELVGDFKFVPREKLPAGAQVGHQYTTGLGARYLGGVNDTKVYPTRGQTLIVYAPQIKETITFLAKDHITYVIPRSDGTVVLGGTANKNDYNPNPEEETIRSIWERTRSICSTLRSIAQPEIVRSGVGLRPSRIDGPRIENEYFSKADGSRILVTHAYGHGGFGYQSSVGAAQYTANLVERGLTLQAKL
ncbi:hypothetical protein BX666DRAFT_2017321 [Dichotomocladium elegans]|nr:hypothetical protein BX666DRAFT_2017321 [Dichotomocladium elegans]